jgi:hypothetical protein
MALELITQKIEFETTMRVTGDDVRELCCCCGRRYLVFYIVKTVVERHFSRCFCWKFSIILLGKQNGRMRS